MKWSIRLLANEARRGCPTGYYVWFAKNGEDELAVICGVPGEFRYSQEANYRTTWDDMIPAPEGMELEDVKKLVEAVLRLKGAA